MRPKLQLIQIFRGFAAIMVALYHFKYETDYFLKWEPVFSSITKYGYLGVDFFFTLSGFIITYAHLKDLRTGNNVASFFKKRVVRIYPVYWIIATYTLLIILFHSHGKVEAANLTLTQSWNSFLYILKCYLLIYQPNKPFLIVSWTLCYEVLFYIIFGLCIFLKYSKARYIYFLWLIIIYLFGFGNYYNINTYLQFAFNPVIIEFLVGCAVAYLYLHKKIISSIVLIGVLVLLIAGYIVYFNHYLPNSLNYLYTDGRNVIASTLFGLTAGLLTYVSAVSSMAKNVTWPSVLLLLGNASYSIYLIQVAALWNAAKFCNVFYSKLSISLTHTPIYLYTFYFSALFLAIAAGSIFYLIVEKNLIDKLKRFTTQKTLKSASQ